METLFDLLGTGKAADPAIIVPEGPRLDYGGLREQVKRTADALAALGLERGDRVALVLPNGAEAVIAFLGAAICATAAPLNPGYTEDEFRFYMEDTEAKALIVPRGAAEAARRAMPEHTLLIEAELEPTGRLRLESAAARQAGRSASAPRGEDVALVLHTSGTTSRPKRVPLRHGNLVASVQQIVATYALSPADVSLCMMPLFHVHGLVASALATLASGGTVVTPPRFNPLGFWPLVQGQRATWYSAVPTIHQLALARTSEGERPPGAETLRFIRSCSSALPAAMMLQLEERVGVPVLEAYGMTEASHQIASNPLPPAPRLPGSVGLGTGVRVGIMDEVRTRTPGGTLLPAGTQGEVVIQGANVTDGYENNPEANAACFTDGWFRTGDLGVLDAAGYVTLQGRIKELINRGGEKISPREVDEVLLLHPAVAEAVCFGAPHPAWGEEVAAAVVLRDAGECVGAPPGRLPVSEADLQRHCREHLAAFKVPKTVHIVETIPRTATGKVQRRHVAAAFARE
jgi:acyl-CoA synthetase (AMP-forming)/AMP-acid ligase II